MDASGDVYVVEEAASVVDEFILGAGGGSAVYAGHLTGTGEEGGAFTNVVSVAVDPQSGVVYVGDEGVERSRVDVFSGNLVVPAIATVGASGVGTAGAVLSGTVDPEGAGAATCRFVWGQDGALEHEAPCEGPGSQGSPVASGAGVTAVHASLSGLAPDSTYSFRLQASNAAGSDIGEAGENQSFTTLGPGILGSVSDVASTSATLEGSVNPDGAQRAEFSNTAAAARSRRAPRPGLKRVCRPQPRNSGPAAKKSN